MQYSAYQDEIAFLQKTTSKCPSLVKQLRLFLDDSKLIRCGDRIHNAPTTDAAKFPQRHYHIEKVSHNNKVVCSVAYQQIR